MANHEISLEVSDACNQKVLRLYDTSHYCDEDITNYYVEVLPPLKSSFIPFNVQKNFSLALNSSSLQYGKVSSIEDIKDLPDGIYEIKQSYKPNSHTVVHFLHLRVVEMRKKLGKEWAKLVSKECKISREDFNGNRDKLREIDEYLLAAKYIVEECLEKQQGKELYEFAAKLLETYTNECRC